MPSGLLGPMNPEPGQLAREAEPLAGPSFVGAPSKLVAFQVTQQMGQSTIPKCAGSCLKSPKRPTKNCISFSVAGGRQCNTLSFILEGMS